MAEANLLVDQLSSVSQRENSLFLIPSRLNNGAKTASTLEEFVIYISIEGLKWREDEMTGGEMGQKRERKTHIISS